MTALAQHLDPLHKIADGAFERDDRVARRKIGEAPAHGFDFGAHGAEFDDRGARIGSLAAHIIELKRQGSNVVEQQLRKAAAGSGARLAAGSAAPASVRRAGISVGRDGSNASCRRLVREWAPRVASRRGRRASSSSWRRMAICDTAALRSNGGFGSSAAGGGKRSPRLSPAKRVGQACPDRFKPPHSVDQRAAVAVSRRVVALEDLGDSFKGARGLRFGAREPRFKALDRGIERVRNTRARGGCACGAFRRAMRSRRPAAAASRSSSASVRVPGPRVLVQHRRSRRSLRRANRQGACRRAGRPPQRRRGSAGPRPRYSTPSLYSCPRPSLGGGESPG